MKNFIAIFFAIAFVSVSTAQSLSESDMEILKLQDGRNFGIDNELIRYLFLGSPETGNKVFNALANIGDSAVFEIEELQNYTPGYLNQHSGKDFAFMLEEIPSLRSTLILERIIEDNSNAFVDDRKYFYLALGKSGDEHSLSKMLSRYTLESSSNNELSAAIAMSIARFALRKIKSVNAVETLKMLVNNSNDTATLRNTAFAFLRINDKDLLENAKEEIYKLTLSGDSQTRMWAYSALGKVKDEMFLLQSLEAFEKETDWRVKVNMLNALTNFNIDSIPHLNKMLLEVLGSYKKGESEHVTLTRLSAIGKLFAGKNSVAQEEIREGLVDIMNSSEYSGRMQGEAANSLALIFKDSVGSELFETFRTTENYELKAAILKAFGNFDDGMIYKTVRDTVSFDVQKYNMAHPNSSGDLIGSEDLLTLYRGFVDMLSKLYSKVGMEDQNTIRLMFSEFSGSKDPYIVDVCLTALRDTVFYEYKEETNSIILFDYRELEYPKDITIMLSYIDALAQLKDTASVGLLEQNLSSPNYDIALASAYALQKINWKIYAINSVPWTDYDWNYLENISKKKFVSVRTNKGNIKIELLPDVAPFTVMNFLKLAEKNFYDGTIFHRVVPNFVIQGGDPSGTGFGGPGYVIRSEFSPLTYERGIVGMASSGKDTEGSQFFITHSATPHLDGKYTIFGKVSEGMDVVDSIMIGDTIEDIIIVAE
ncbi:MAG: peptidylprolyl isomerase [bacterium]|nr:peptidylprolyl isomerase [bacterium]